MEVATEPAAGWEQSLHATSAPESTAAGEGDNLAARAGSEQDSPAPKSEKSAASSGPRGLGSVRATGSKTGLSHGAMEANPLLAALRREVGSSEQRLSDRVGRAERNFEQLREMMLTRLDQKFEEAQTWQLEYEQRLGQLGGSLKGATEELPSLVRRVCQMETRLAEAQRRAEESVRSHVAELEQKLQEGLGASGRTTSSGEDANTARRFTEAAVQRVQILVDNLADSHGRRLDLAEAQLDSLSEEIQRCRSTAVLCKQEVEQSAEETEKAHRATDRLSAELRRSQAHSEEQEVRISNLTDKIALQETQLRTLSTQLLRADFAACRKEVTSDAVSAGSVSIATGGSTTASPSEEDQARFGGPIDNAAEIHKEVAGHSKVLDEMRHGMEEMKRNIDLLRRAALKGGGLQALGLVTQHKSSTESLIAEVQALTEAVSAGEAAIHSLVPHLLAAIAPGNNTAGDPKVKIAAHGLEAACADDPVNTTTDSVSSISEEPSPHRHSIPEKGQRCGGCFPFLSKPS